MRESEMYEPVRRFMKERFEDPHAPYYCDECVTRSGTRADLVVVQSRRDVLHVVELKAAISDMNDVLEQVLGYPANYRWLAVADDVYASWPGLYSTCAGEGIGLLVVGGSERHWVTLKVRAVRQDGDHLDEYPRIAKAWVDGW